MNNRLWMFAVVTGCCYVICVVALAVQIANVR